MSCPIEGCGPWALVDLRPGDSPGEAYWCWVCTECGVVEEHVEADCGWVSIEEAGQSAAALRLAYSDELDCVGLWGGREGTELLVPLGKVHEAASYLSELEARIAAARRSLAEELLGMAGARAKLRAAMRRII